MQSSWESRYDCWLRRGNYLGGLPGRRRHCRGPTPALGLPGMKGTAPSSTMQSSLRTTLRSALACSTTTVRSSTARTCTDSSPTTASKPAATSWFNGGTMLASGTSSAVRVMCDLRATLGLDRQKKRRPPVGAKNCNRAALSRGAPGRVGGLPIAPGSLPTTPGRVPGRDVTETYVIRVDEAPLAVHQHLRFPRRRFDHRRP